MFFGMSNCGGKLTSFGKAVPSLGAKVAGNVLEPGVEPSTRGTICVPSGNVTTPSTNVIVEDRPAVASKRPCLSAVGANGIIVLPPAVIDPSGLKVTKPFGNVPASSKSFTMSAGVLVGTITPGGKGALAAGMKPAGGAKSAGSELPAIGVKLGGNVGSEPGSEVIGANWMLPAATEPSGSGRRSASFMVEFAAS